MVSRGICNISL